MKKNDFNIDHSFYKWLTSGIMLNPVVVFGKAGSSSTCPKCKPTKKVWVNISDSLRDSSPEIWKLINLFLLERNHIPYKSSNEHSTLMNAEDLIELEASD